MDPDFFFFFGLVGPVNSARDPGKTQTPTDRMLSKLPLSNIYHPEKKFMLYQIIDKTRNFCSLSEKFKSQTALYSLK